MLLFILFVVNSCLNEHILVVHYWVKLHARNVSEAQAVKHGTLHQPKGQNLTNQARDKASDKRQRNVRRGNQKKNQKHVFNISKWQEMANIERALTRGPRNSNIKTRDKAK